MLRWLGLSKETRVHISAPGIDVVLSGEPRRVRRLLDIITDALDDPSERARRFPVASERGRGKARAAPSSQIVEPSELDEMDSPYALPEAEPLVRPAAEPHPDRTYEIPGRNAARRRGVDAASRPRAAPRAPSLAFEERAPEPPTRLPTPDAELEPPLEATPVDAPDAEPHSESDAEPDSERTAVSIHPASDASFAPEIDVTDTRLPSEGLPSEQTLEAPRFPAKRRGSSS